MKEKMIFLNFSEPPNPPDKLAQHVSKKNFSDELFLIFPSTVQNLTVFSIIYMIRVRFFGPRGLNQKGFRTAQSCENTKKHVDFLRTACAPMPLPPWSTFRT